MERGGDPLVTDRLLISRVGPRHLRVAGELDIASSPALAEELQGLVGSGKGPVILELADLTFLDSTGLRVLIDAAQKLGESGDLVLRNPTRAATEVLEIAGVVEAASNLVIERDD